jgi:2-polyprenyl-6-methoxyphenol hydroxylase-like FAD-dependent oxidoreductase
MIVGKRCPTRRGSFAPAYNRLVRILVVGGGIGGLTAAIALCKVGIDVQAYERASALREVGAGIALSANALEALDTLGLAADIRSQSFALMQGGLRNPKGDVLLSIPADDFNRGLWQNCRDAPS